MKRLITLCILANILFANNDNNIGFLMNQKYLCIPTHILVGDEVKVISKEEAFTYPTRFYIDSDLKMHTDSPKYNLFNQLSSSIYENDMSTIQLKIENNQRIMLRLFTKGPMKGFIFYNKCVETENWTLVK